MALPPEAWPYAQCSGYWKLVSFELYARFEVKQNHNNTTRIHAIVQTTYPAAWWQSINPRVVRRLLSELGTSWQDQQRIYLLTPWIAICLSVYPWIFSITSIRSDSSKRNELWIILTNSSTVPWIIYYIAAKDVTVWLPFWRGHFLRNHLCLVITSEQQGLSFSNKSI